MRVAGIHIQEEKKDLKIQHAVSEPYGLEMILAVAKQEGHDVDLFVAGEQKETVEKISAFKPDIAAFSLYTLQYNTGKNIAAELKRRIPNLTVVAGNRYPTFLKEKIEQPFDFFVIKEGEESFRELLSAIGDGHNYEDIRGLVFRKNNQPVFTGVRERKFDLDSLPDALRFPVILNQVYKAVSIPPLSSCPHYAVIESSRCCYNNCKFCDNNGFWGNKVVARSHRRVVDEMAKLKERGVDIFYFMDLNFTAFPERARELCNKMIEQKLNANWYCMSNVSTLDSQEGRDLLSLMKEAGCFKIAYGIESTNDSALKKMNKRVGKNFAKTEQAIRVLESSLRAGMINQGFYIIGFPWETAESIVRDSQKLKNIPIHQLNIGIFTPIPLSRFYNEMVQEGYVIDANLEHHDRNTLVFNHKGLCKTMGNPNEDMNNGNKVLKLIQERICLEFYSSPEFISRVKRTCDIDPRFRKSFNDYFEFTGKEMRI